MHRIVYTVQKATFCTEIYGASGQRMFSGCCMYCNQHSNAYAKVDGIAQFVGIMFSNH